MTILFGTWGTLAVYACISSPVVFSPSTRKVFQANDGLVGDSFLSQEAISMDLREYPVWLRDIGDGRHAHRTGIGILLGRPQRHPKEVFDAVQCALY
jgi:hypothetical protein